MRTTFLTAGTLLLAATALACGGRPDANRSPAAPTWSPAMPSTLGGTLAAETALARWVAATGTTHGAYFLPPTSQDANGNDVLAGTSRVFVSQSLEGGGTALCTMETDGSHSFFRIGPKGVMDHVNGPATLKYQRYAAGGALVETLAGSGKLNVHIQGELQTLIADGENGETWTILSVDPGSSSQTISGAGKVGPAGGAATRDLRCGLKSDAKGGAPKTYVELR
jgi:hypothetical protein